MMKNLNLPNFLTALRILCIPLVIHWVLDGQLAWGLGLLIFSLTLDYFDGHLARKLGQTSHFGAVFDPVADKTVVFAYYLFIYLETDLMPLALLLLTFARNLSQLSVIPVLSWWLKIPFQVKPKFLPKLATALSFIILVLGTAAVGAPEIFEHRLLEWTLLVLLGLSGLLEAYVLVTFLPRYLQVIRRKHDTFE